MLLDDSILNQVGQMYLSSNKIALPLLCAEAQANWVGSRNKHIKGGWWKQNFPPPPQDSASMRESSAGRRHLYLILRVPFVSCTAVLSNQQVPTLREEGLETARERREWESPFPPAPSLCLSLDPGRWLQMIGIIQRITEIMVNKDVLSI